MLLCYIFRMKIVEEIQGNKLKYITHVESGDHLNELNERTSGIELF